MDGAHINMQAKHSEILQKEKKEGELGGPGVVILAPRKDRGGRSTSLVYILSSYISRPVKDT